VLNRFGRQYPAAPPPKVVGRTDWRVHASVHGFEEAVFHVLENALNAHRSAGVAVPVEIELTTSSEQIDIVVRDRGEGIRTDLEDRLLSPFVTSRLPGDGLGLGLTLTALALRRSGGDVALSSRPDGGTEVRLSFLPARADAPLLFDEDDSEDIAAR
jgi:C4-dicarboxylate-specific signal transduction histidine kinase